MDHSTSLNMASLDTTSVFISVYHCKYKFCTILNTLHHGVKTEITCYSIQFNLFQ